MAAYLIACHEVTDPAGFKDWRAKALPIIQRHGGRAVVRSDKVEVLDGDSKASDVVVLEFKDRATLDAARAELKEHSAIRQKAARTVLLAVE